MLTFHGSRHRYCDGLSRRSFLQVGSLALGGLTLPQLLQAESRRGSSDRSVILVYLSGGLAHQDTFDLKPNAPAEVRGEFKPIDTNVPGIQICEHLPLLSRCMDRMAVLRSIVGQRDEHSSFHTLAGYPMDQTKREMKPHVGSVIAKVLGQRDPVVPAFIDLFPTMQHRPYNSPGVGLLGRAAAPARLDPADLEPMKLQDITLGELDDRRKLLERFDALKRQADSGALALEGHYQRAFDVLTSSKLVEAVDVSREPAKVRERYGKGSPKHMGDGAPMWNDQLLMARRLVEAGARVVTVAYGFWDTHGGNFKHLKRHLPLFDQGISALVEDIYARGLDRSTTVLVWGEFGRTPKINKDAGRDHWAPVNSAIFAGGDLKVGQVIGSTDATAARAVDTPIHYQDVLATMYQALGIDPHAMVYDVSGRPNPILPSGVRPVERLF
jgi:hypothetical protein